MQRMNSRALLNRGMRLIVHPVPDGQDVDVDLVMRQVFDHRTDG